MRTVREIYPMRYEDAYLPVKTETDTAQFKPVVYSVCRVGWKITSAFVRQKQRMTIIEGFLEKEADETGT